MKYVIESKQSSIIQFINDFDFKPTKGFVLVTHLDSHPKPVSFRDKLPPLFVQFGDALLAPAGFLHDFKDEVFFGFDEFFYFTGKPIQVKPNNLQSLVGPNPIEKLTPELEEWLSTNYCMFGVGDGAGVLNMVIRS